MRPARAPLQLLADRAANAAPIRTSVGRLCRFEHDTPILRAQYIEYQRMNTALGEQVERLQARPAFAMP